MMLWLVALGAAVFACGGWLCWWRLRVQLVAARAETERLRSLVKKRVERPNVFSHEVRTPLTLVKGAAELLAEQTPGPLNQRQLEFVQTITENTQQVIALAEDLLTEAKIESQLFELRLERFDLKVLIREVVRDARRIHSADIRLVEPTGPLQIIGDRALLTQALRNLVINACRHGGDGARVKVSASLSEGQAVVSVTDDGVGMSPEQRDRLFEPFAVGSSQRAGTGLGMMITERIIAQHEGQLLVDTLPGHGTTIFFTIPLERGRE